MAHQSGGLSRCLPLLFRSRRPHRPRRFSGGLFGFSRTLVALYPFALLLFTLLLFRALRDQNFYFSNMNELPIIQKTYDLIEYFWLPLSRATVYTQTNCLEFRLLGVRPLNPPFWGTLRLKKTSQKMGTLTAASNTSI